MIHTYQLRIKLRKEQLKEIMFYYDFKPIHQIFREIEKQIEGIRISIVEEDFESYINIHVDAIKALKTYEITEESICSLLSIHDNICDYLLIDSNETLNHTRIDYRIDIKVQPKEHRELILKLFNKTKSKHYHLKKETEYKSTVYLKNKSMEIKVYDKEKERKAKGERVREEEKGVIRFEVALRARHLRYNKKMKGIIKNIQTYLTKELHFKYMEKIVEVFFGGNFYHLTDVETILEEREVSLSNRKQVRELMITISKLGYAGAQKEFSAYLIKKCLAILRDANIHPVPIPKNANLVNYNRDNPLINPVNEIINSIQNFRRLAEKE